MLQRATYRVGLFLVLSLSACACLAANYVESAAIGGRTREWLVHLPPNYKAGQAMPLVVVYHGSGGNSDGAGIESGIGLDAVADRMGFIAVYPDGVDHAWGAGADSAADEDGVDDVAFTAALVDELEQEYSIDNRHVVAVGFSNGAHMVHLLGCRLADRFTAVVPVSGTLVSSESASCHPVRPITVVEFHGSADPIDPYGGGRVGIHGTAHAEPVTNGIGAWAIRDNCQSRSTDKKLPPSSDGMTVWQQDFPGCTGGAHVRLYTIIGAGHVWPWGQTVNATEIVGQLAVGKLVF